jgi:hypothetical protein
MTSLEEFARALAECDALVRDALLRDHIADGHGRCRICTLESGRGRPRWPCRLHVVASLASAVVEIPAPLGPAVAAAPIGRRRQGRNRRYGRR